MAEFPYPKNEVIDARGLVLAIDDVLVGGYSILGESVATFAGYTTDTLKEAWNTSKIISLAPNHDYGELDETLSADGEDVIIYGNNARISQSLTTKKSIFNLRGGWTDYQSVVSITPASENVDECTTIATGWTLNTGWSSTGFVFQHSSGTGTATRALTGLSSGVDYRVEIEIGGVTTGNLTISLTNSDVYDGELYVTSDTTAVILFTASGTSETFVFTPSSSFNGYITTFTTITSFALTVSNASNLERGELIKIIDSQQAADTPRSGCTQGEFLVIASVNKTTNTLYFSATPYFTYSTSSNCRIAKLKDTKVHIVGPLRLESPLEGAGVAPGEWETLVQLTALKKPVITDLEVIRSWAALMEVSGCYGGRFVRVGGGYLPNDDGGEGDVAVGISTKWSEACVNEDCHFEKVRHAVTYNQLSRSMVNNDTDFDIHGYTQGCFTRNSVCFGASQSAWDTHHGTVNCGFINCVDWYSNAPWGIRGTENFAKGCVSYRPKYGASVFRQSGSAYVNVRSRRNRVEDCSINYPEFWGLRVRRWAYDTLITNLTIRVAGGSLSSGYPAQAKSGALWAYDGGITLHNSRIIVTGAVGPRGVIRIDNEDGLKFSAFNSIIDVSGVDDWNGSPLVLSDSSNPVVLENFSIVTAVDTDAPDYAFTVPSVPFSSESRFNNVCVSNLNVGIFSNSYGLSDIQPMLTGRMSCAGKNVFWEPYGVTAGISPWGNVETEELLKQTETYLSRTQKEAYDDFITELKSEGVWAKLDTIYVPVGSNGSLPLVNLKNPGTYSLTVLGGFPTFSSSGVILDGVDDYYTTNFAPGSTAGSVTTQTDAHIGLYVTSNNDDAWDVGNGAIRLAARSSGSITARVFTAASLTETIAAATGHTIVDREGTAVGFWKDGVEVNTQTNTADIAASTGGVQIGMVGNSFSSQTIACVHFGAHLSDARIGVLTTAVDTLLTALGAIS